MSQPVPKLSAESCARFSAEVAQLEKAEDVVVLDLRGLAGFTDFFVNPAAGWLLADYVDFVIHVFSPESRELYQLEKLWGDAARWYPEPPGANPAAPPGTP